MGKTFESLQVYSFERHMWIACQIQKQLFGAKSPSQIFFSYKGLATQLFYLIDRCEKYA